MADEPFEFPVRVYYEDTDAQGVVYYANYFRFMERARTEWLDSLGIDHIHLMRERQRILVITDVEAKFLQPARLGDRLVVTAALARMGRASFDIEQRILRGGSRGELLLRGQVSVAYVDSVSMRPKRIPDKFLEGNLK